MSGPLGSSQWMYASGAAEFYDYSIDQSLRFNDNDSAYLIRTPASAGNQKTWTWSAWVKRANISTNQTLFSGGTGSTLSVEIRLGSDNKFHVLDTNNTYLFSTTQLFRDVGAWYHFVIECDTTQATVNDRTKLYVNGEQVTSFSTDNRSNFSQNEDTAINSANAHYIGRWINGGLYFDGYMAEVNFIDGTALDADSFGETKNGVWVPKEYSGSYGTNGFYLSFADSAAPGRDKAGSKTLVTSTSFSTIGGGTTNFSQSEADKGFDNDKSTNCDRTGSSGLIEITPTSSVTPVSHTMINASSGSYTAASRPNSVKLQGSNDGGSTWTDIDTMSNGSGANTETTSSFSNTTSYAKLRLNIASNQGGSNTRFSEYIVFASEDNGDGENIFFKNNLAASDVMSNESPTNNFATLNSAHNQPNITFSEGNLRHQNSVTNSGVLAGFLLPKSGIWYWEHLSVSFNYPTDHELHSVGINVPEADLDGTRGGRSTGVTYASNTGNKFVESGTGASYGDSWEEGDIVGVEFDADSGTINFSKNGTFQGDISITASKDWLPFVGMGGGTSSSVGVFNFGQDSSFAGQKTSGSAEAQDANGVGDFYYSPPSGALALCTANLPEPTIGPHTSTTNSDENFNTILWTGNATNTGSRSLTGVGHAPDFVWIKTRNQANEHSVFDSVRGTGKDLESNSTAAEVSNNVNGYISSFDSDGFTVTTGSSGNALVNYTNNTFVAWNWKAGGTAVSNTDGTITSSVSVNDAALFSIGTYQGNGTVGATVGHGLGVEPNLLIIKNRSAAQGWPVKVVPPFAGGTRVQLESTSASTTESAGTGSLYNATNPSSSVITLGDQAMTNTSGSNYVFYAFANVEGYCKIGTYSGNNSTDGPFVYCGFRPRLIWFKRYNQTGGSWRIMDTARDPINVADARLFADSNSAEDGTRDVIDILSNGFKLRANNAGNNGATTNSFIFAAWAEQPFKYANAR